MKTRTAILSLILALVFLISFMGRIPGLPGVITASQGNVDTVVQGNNVFAFDLFRTVAKEKGNLFLSPFSISSALAMAFAGARGETARQMEKTLHFDAAGSNLHPGFSELMKGFNAPDKGYQLAVANALWGQRGTPFHPAFVETTRKYYEAGFREVDFANDTEGARKVINSWVESKTNNKIVELLKPGILNGLTRLVLTNAIYFKGKWAKPFKPEHTQEAPFHVSPEEKPNVPLMFQSGEFLYTENDAFQILELPYNGNEVVMDILLPKPKSNLSQSEATLQAVQLEAWLHRLSRKEVQVFLPRFKLEKSLSLGAYLQSLGMIDAFDDQRANFSGISTTFLYIAHVIHKAFVEVNEEGTEAAAATAVVMGTKSAPMNEPVLFRVDRPFLFLIRETRTGSILFMGRMADPR